MKRPTAPSRPCGTGKRRRRSRRKKARKVDHSAEEIHPAWLLRQAERVKLKSR